jgi:hypothetical protein
MNNCASGKSALFILMPGRRFLFAAGHAKRTRLNFGCFGGEAYGRVLENFSFRRWSQFVTTSAFSESVNWNMKSAGNRWGFRLTA